VLDRLQAEPGIVAAAVTNAVPLSAATPIANPFTIEGRATDDANKRPTADVRVITPGYFKTLGIPLVGGRTFSDRDHKDAPAVALINKAMLRYWDGKDPIGSRISFSTGPNNDPIWTTIVGVVGDVRQFGLEQTVAQIYQPMSQSQGFGGRFLIRTQGDPTLAAKVLRDDIHAVDAAMPVVNVKTLDDLRDRYLATPKLTAVLLTIFAALALVVTMAGLTGVIATSVSQRTQEFGVRMALGASRERVLGLVIAQGLALVVIGLGVGIAAATALTRVLSTYLFDTQPTDPITFALVATAFVAAGVIACAGPAWRATTVDPMTALRAD
jgi:predicted permease